MAVRVRVGVRVGVEGGGYVVEGRVRVVRVFLLEGLAATIEIF